MDSASIPSSLSFPFFLWLILLPQGFCVLCFLWVLLGLLFHIQTIFQYTFLVTCTGWLEMCLTENEEGRASTPLLFQSRDWEEKSDGRGGLAPPCDCNCFSNVCIWTSLQLSLHHYAPPHTSGKMTIVTPVEIIAVLKNFKGHEEWILRHIHLGTNK